MSHGTCGMAQRAPRPSRTYPTLCVTSHVSYVCVRHVSYVCVRQYVCMGVYVHHTVHVNQKARVLIVMCERVLQSVAECCSVLQRVAVCRRVVQSAAESRRMLQVC